MPCPHCRTGRIIPKYRKGKKPIYRCNKCKKRYTPGTKR